MARTGRPAPPAEERFLRLDGQVIDVEATAVPVTYKGESATLVHFRDITERKQADRALREAEQRFRVMCEHFPVGMAISRDGRTIYANAAYVKMFGFESLSDLQGTPILDQIASSRRREISERVHRRALGNPEPTKYETTGLRKDGTEFPFLVQLAPIELADGPATAGFFVDVTERKRLEAGLHTALAELEKVQRRMRSLAKKTADAQEKECLYLASEIHDDLLQGLSSASYFLYTLDVTSLDAETRETKERLLESVTASLERGRSLIDEIRPVDSAGVRVASALERSVGLIFAKDGSDVKYVCPKRMPRLRQLAGTNILRIAQEAMINIRKHARAGKVSVKLSLQGSDKLVLRIEDDGVGFDQRTLPPGLPGRYGLLLMKQRADLIGGKLIVTSRPGKGTIVKGIFPLADIRAPRR